MRDHDVSPGSSITGFRAARSIRGCRRDRRARPRLLLLHVVLLGARQPRGLAPAMPSAARQTLSTLDLARRTIALSSVSRRSSASGGRRTAKPSSMRQPEPMLLHGEIVRRDGRALGYVRAGSHGHTLGGAGLAMIEADAPIDADHLARGSWEVEIGAGRYPVVLSLDPLPRAHRHVDGDVGVHVDARVLGEGVAARCTDGVSARARA